MTPPVFRLIFFVRETYPTSRPDVEVLFAEELPSRGHQIDFVMQAGRDTDRVGQQIWHGQTVWVGATDSGGGFLSRLHRQWLGIRHDVRVFTRIRAAQYEAVQVRDKFVIAAIVALAARRRGIKFIYWLSFPEPESQLARARAGTARYPLMNLVRGKVFGWLLYRLILPRCDHAFVQSEQMRRDLAERGIDPGKLTPVPMGVAKADVRSAGGRSGVVKPDAFLTLAYLGTLDAQRRLEVLLEMLALLRQQGHKVRLLMVGGGDDDQDRLRLERSAEHFGVLRDLEITGFLPREIALARTGGADICLSPFFPTPVLRSTSPTKLVEYLALGCPVVANDHPEQRRVLNDSRAGVCVPWGARYFARGVAWLADRGPTVRQQMGESGRQWVLAHRTYGTIAGQLEQKYLRILAAPHA
jgi:glycosyltransferase involved in cell wall biosynthesis